MFFLEKLWQKNYPLIVIPPLIITLLLFSILINKNLGYNLFEMMFLLLIIWELIWIITYSNNKLIIFQSILRISNLILYIMLIYFLLSPYFGPSIIGSSYDNTNIGIVYILFLLLLLFGVLNHQFYNKFLIKTEKQFPGLTSWKKSNN
jgi:hypothetical protein